MDVGQGVYVVTSMGASTGSGAGASTSKSSSSSSLSAGPGGLIIVQVWGGADEVRVDGADDCLSVGDSILLKGGGGGWGSLERYITYTIPRLL